MSKLNHRDLGLTDEQALEIYYLMLITRKLDERFWLLNRAGKIPFVVSCQGQEATQVGSAYAMDKTIDWVAPYYRDLGTVVTFGQTPTEVMMSAFAKPGDVNSCGRQMPGHFGGKKYRTLTGSSPVTTQFPHAVGAALAAKMRGEKSVVYTSTGEGSSNQGDFHEACNFAGVHKLPVIFNIVNNGYAISVPLEKQLGNHNTADRAIGYGMPGISIDGNDVLEVYKTFKEAVDRARNGGGPTMIETRTYRLVPHSSDDDDRAYRTREEVEAAKKKDPLVTYPEYLRSVGVLTPEKEQEINDRVTREVNEGTETAEKAEFFPPEDALTHVYEEL